MLTLKPEYVGEVMEIMRDDIHKVFDTNVEGPETYEYFYEIGFDWAFDKTE